MGNRRTLSGVPSGKRARTMPEKTVPAASAPASCATAKSGGGEVPVTRPGGTKSLPEDQLLLSGRKITALPEHAGKRLPGRSAFPGTRLPPPLLKRGTVTPEQRLSSPAGNSGNSAEHHGDGKKFQRTIPPAHRLSPAFSASDPAKDTRIPFSPNIPPYGIIR